MRLSDSEAVAGDQLQPTAFFKRLPYQRCDECLSLVEGGRARKEAKKGKTSKAELLEAAKRRQEQLKTLEGTREGRVCILRQPHAGCC